MKEQENFQFSDSQAIAEEFFCSLKKYFNNPDTNMEQPMHTESDIFSSPKSQDAGNTDVLTQRLYSSQAEGEGGSFATQANKAAPSAFEELRRLAQSAQSGEHEASVRFNPQEMLDDSVPNNHILEQRIKSFLNAQSELTRSYLEKAKSRKKMPDFELYYLSGWPKHKPAMNTGPDYLFLTEQSRKTSGGIFIRWNGKGIAINPGEGFLKNFHHEGLHVRDIDFVIVTGDQPDNYADVKEIYDLAYQLNKVSPDLQIIQYYFNQKAFQELSRFLKPHFKQERNSLHSLELFVDSPDVEKIELSEGILLHYFQASSREGYALGQESKEDRATKNHSSIGIRIDFKSHGSFSADKATSRIGYISNAAWNPLLAHHLGTCDILITGFGNTSHNDFNKLSYNSDCLGYYGTATLLEEVAPRILLTGEFGGREGDIRLETAMKMRQEFLAHSLRSSRQSPVVLPADTGLMINLKTLQIKCSVSEQWIEPSQVKAIKTSPAFGRLEYLAPTCCY